MEDGLGKKPFSPAEVVADVDVRDLSSEDIGLIDSAGRREGVARLCTGEVRIRYRIWTRPNSRSQYAVRGIATG